MPSIASHSSSHEMDGNAIVQPSELHILCFGASITAGFYAIGLKHHPYSIRLKDRLQESFPSRQIMIDVEGSSGDRVLDGEYLPRLQSRLASTKYDFVVFQGGGNDLVWEREPTAIFEQLKRFWKMCLDSGARLLALTVTETEDQSLKNKERYAKLNEMISNHQDDGYFVADVCSRVPYGAMDKGLRKQVFDDGLHFKPLGYDMIGDAIADRFLEML